jgi:hypothetical protein
MKRLTFAAVLATALAILQVITMTQAHARWGGSWVLGKLARPAFPYAYSGSGYYCCGYPAYWPSYAYAGYPYAPAYYGGTCCGSYLPYHRRAWRGASYRAGRRGTVHRTH